MKDSPPLTATVDHWVDVHTPGLVFPLCHVVWSNSSYSRAGSSLQLPLVVDTKHVCDYLDFMSELMSKTSQLQNAWNSGDRIGALRIASRFFDRSPETKAFQRGWDAHSNPRFYQQIGKNPAQLVEAALTALAAKFGLN
jgi:hypothetical protein